MSDISKVIRQYNLARDKFTAEVKDGLNVIFKDFFAKYPQFDNISWEQYTDYFNDGEQCDFHVREKEYEAESLTGYGFRAPGSWERRSAYTKTFVETYDALPQETRDEYERLEAAFNELADTLDNIPTEMYLDIFGDHKKIIVTKEGITVESYTDHD